MNALSLSTVPLARLAVALVVLLTITACGAAPPSRSTAGRGGVAASESPTASPPPLTLYVSNQSFDDPHVGITIAIDGVVVVDRRFAVDNQHNWIAFEPAVGPGDHVLTASSDTGAELRVEFTIEAGEPRWAVVNYWWYPGDGPRHFTFDISDEPIGFA